MKKIMLVFGTRPEAIKMAPLVKEFQKYPEKFITKVCVTAQHREMLDQVLQLFEIVPDYDLNIMQKQQDLYDITSKTILGMRDILALEKPDVILVHGDTTTSVATALSAFYQQIPVGHVEAGLRTYNVLSPWPEEMNRQITGRIATYHFAPTLLNQKNLIAEGVNKKHILITGNTVIDALLFVSNKLNSIHSLKQSIEQMLSKLGMPKEIQTKWMTSRKMTLITGHRRENFGEGFLKICKAIQLLSKKYTQVDFVYPVHLNPNVQKPVFELLQNIPNVYLLKPLEYLPFVYLMQKSHIILTDSGGIQEEAPGFRKPVLVMRDTTERQEAVEAGTVKLVGTDINMITNSFDELMTNKSEYNKMVEAANPYGDGNACSKIVSYFL